MATAPKIQKFNKPTRFTNTTKKERMDKERRLKSERSTQRRNKKAEKQL